MLRTKPKAAGRKANCESLGGHPSLGCVVSKLQGATTANSLPTFVDLGGPFEDRIPWARSIPDSVRIAKAAAICSFSRSAWTVSIAARELLGQLDRIRRDIDGTHAMDAMDAFNQRAVGLITSNKMAEALDWEKADPKVRERYGIGAEQQLEHVSRRQAADRMRSAGHQLELGRLGHARRQFQNASPPIASARHRLERDDRRPRFLGPVEQHDHRDVGRIRPHAADQRKAGRDHWARAASALVAGGGMRMGQVIGSTNRYGETAQDRPVHLQEMFATFYHLLGIDPRTTTIRDPNGRPQYLVAHPDPIAELIG